MELDELLSQINETVKETVKSEMAAQAKPAEEPKEAAPVTAEAIAQIIKDQTDAAKADVVKAQEDTAFNLHLNGKSPEFTSYLSEATDPLGKKWLDRIGEEPTLEGRVAALDTIEKDYRQASARGSTISPVQRKAIEAKENMDSEYDELNDKRANEEISHEQWRKNFWGGPFMKELSLVADAA